MQIRHDFFPSVTKQRYQMENKKIKKENDTTREKNKINHGHYKATTKYERKQKKEKKRKEEKKK